MNNFGQKYDYVSIKVYHGSRVVVEKPDLSLSKADIDFGVGFYTTTDFDMAAQWAAGKQKAVINEYMLNLADDLRIAHLSLDSTWLAYISWNRDLSDIPVPDDKYDIVIGPTADDKIFSVLGEYWDGNITEEQALMYLCVIGINEQMVLKTESALRHLRFVEAKELSTERLRSYREMRKNNRKAVIRKLYNMINREEILPIC